MLTTWRRRNARTQLAFTGRTGGTSRAPYDSLNLGAHVGDDTDAVVANRAALAAELGAAPSNLLFLDQVHGTEVATARQSWDSPPRADAAVTSTPGLHLAVMVADCVPVVLADDAAGVVAVAHAGRKGLADGVLQAAVAAMETHGATRVVAVAGPSICGACYEVPAQMRDEVDAAVRGTAGTTRGGTPGLDLAAGVVSVLAGLGVETEVLPGCTAESQDLYSYRRARVTGRFAGVAGVLA